MTTLLFRFPGGRYHATPWGHHVNEGLVEWPPSPWRIVRALLACGYATEGWVEGRIPGSAVTLVQALTSCLPSYRLPAASLAHSRHYMPLAKFKNGNEDTTLVLDAWARVDGPLSITWPIELRGDARDLLDRLAARLGYLGRSESWVEGELLGPGQVPEPNCYPASAAPTPPGKELTRILCPDTESEFAHWRQEELNRMLGASAGQGRRVTNAARTKAEAPYPADLMACLHRDTAENQKHGWSQPPGSRYVSYWRPIDALRAFSPRAAQPRSGPRVEAILLALASGSRSRRVLPQVQRTLPQAELLHRALVACADRQGRSTIDVLTGLDPEGKPLRDHQHAHILPLDLDDDDHIDHVLLFARKQFDDGARRAVRSMRRTFTKGGAGELQVAIAGEAGLGDLVRLPSPYGNALASYVGPARTWESSTPFVPPRHLKRRGRNTLSGQVVAELACRGLPEATVEVLPISARNLAFRHFVRRRRPGAPQPPADIGLDLRITFPAPVQGPICLGYGSHFGLGAFRATRSD
ncbi:MAG: type I-U CRISPR-associated protein Cas5/Cas6 [Planctomycetes bacterium]|nr:type I-U CRISPR-associated protein Cas5/Cas6 [Planctomycetota bacterium]MCC7065155.1 type I-U CRISPR-associated protein Cas5/Cas6 [Planctomycetota bacterium]